MLTAGRVKCTQPDSRFLRIAYRRAWTLPILATSHSRWIGAVEFSFLREESQGLGPTAPRLVNGRPPRPRMNIVIPNTSGAPLNPAVDFAMDALHSEA